MNLLIKNARIIDKDKDFVGEILVKDGKIFDFGEKLDSNEENVFYANGKTLMPAFVELHAHFREPGYTHKETIETGSLSALHGGYTFVNCMGNTNPISSSMAVYNEVMEKFKELDLIDGNQVITITKDFDGKTISHLDELNGVKVISEDGKGVNSSVIMYEAMKKAKEYDMTVMVHAEDMDMTKISYRLSENLETIRDIYLSKETGCKLHLSHVSTKEAIKAIREAKKENPNLTCEVSPHHIYLYDNDYRVNPPIREKDDVEELIRGILDGTVDAIATDHAPHTKEDKEKGAPGLVGLETSFAVVNHALVRTGKINLNKLSELMSFNPSKIMDINKGLIEKGYDADFVVVDENEEVVVNPEVFKTKGRNTPFANMKFTGKIISTIKAGKVYNFN